MNLKQKFAISFAILATASLGLAETASGTLGQRYLSLGFAEVNYDGTDTNSYGAGFGVNIPVSTHFDFSMGYDFGWLKERPLYVESHTVSAVTTAYISHGSMKPFVSVGLGYTLASAKIDTFKASDDHGSWLVGAGVEIPVGAVTITPAVGYIDGFESGFSSQTQFSVQADHWFTEMLNGYVGLSYIDSDGDKAWSYSIGARLKF